MNLYGTQNAPLLNAIHGWEPQASPRIQRALGRRSGDEHTAGPPKPLKEQFIEAVAGLKERIKPHEADLQVAKLIRALQQLKQHKANAAGAKLTAVLTQLHQDGAGNSPSLTSLTANRLVTGLAREEVDLWRLRSKFERLHEAEGNYGCAEVEHLFFLVKTLTLVEDMDVLKKLKLILSHKRVNPDAELLPTHIVHLNVLKERAASLLTHGKAYAENGVILGTKVTLNDLQKVSELDLRKAHAKAVKDFIDLATARVDSTSSDSLVDLSSSSD